MEKYSEEEHALWHALSSELGELHERYACAAIREASARVRLRRDRIPTLAEVGDVLHAATGFRMEPVRGLVPAREFFGALARGVFLSTEYIRDARTPHYTPEPDIVHELLGHAASLAHPKIAELNRALGRASLTMNDSEMRSLERFYWFSLEFGLVMEHGAPKALGAGLLSSVAELQRACSSSSITLRPFSFDAIGRTEFRTDAMQDVLFVAPSLDAIVSASSSCVGSRSARSPCASLRSARPHGVARS